MHEQETPTPLAENQTSSFPHPGDGGAADPWEGYSQEILDAVLDP